MKKTKTSPVLQLVKSYRNTEGQPRQKILLSLGDVAIPKELWKQIASGVDDKLKGISSLFEPSTEIKHWIDTIVSRLETKPADQHIPSVLPVDTETIETRRHRSLGTVLAGKKAWDSLNLHKILAECSFSPTQQRDVMLSVINRLCEPVSENALPGWLNTVALDELICEPLDLLDENRFYRISDTLLRNKETIEAKLADQQKLLFGSKHTILLYDITNTYFEGRAEENDIAQRGFSKEKRFDCPLVSCGMVLDENGSVVKHNSFTGNLAEAKTLTQQLLELKKDYPGAMIVMDAGISNQGNLDLVREHGFHYITVGKRPLRMLYKEKFENIDDFKVVANRADKPEVLIKTFSIDTEKLVCCLSSQRKVKEDAMLSKAEKRLLKDLEGLADSIASGHMKDREKINKRIGRLAERHSRVFKYYSVRLSEDNRLEYERKELHYQQASMLNGGYVLRCSDKSISDEDIWHIYILLTRVEAGFKNLKSDLGIRPIYHQTARRTEGHIFISVLAYQLLHWIESRLKDAGLHIGWQSVKRLLQTHSYCTVTMSTPHGQLSIRKPSIPEAAQQQIYDILGIDLTKLPTHKSLIA